MHKVASLVAGCLLVLFLGVTTMVGLLSVYQVRVIWAEGAAGDEGNGADAPDGDDGDGGDGDE